GARRIAMLFAATIATAIGVHSFLHLPPVLGMMTGLGYLQLLDYFLQLRGRRRGRLGDYTFDVFQRIAGVEWDTLLFFYGVMMCVGALALLGYLTLASHLLYGQLGTDPSRYRHWKLDIEPPLAWLTLDVDPAGGLFPGAELKLNSYDLGVDIELADAVQRLRFEHPGVRCVVIRSGKDNVFCAGAN